MSRLYLRCFHCLCRLNLRAVQNSKVVIVDGNQMFARPGPRLVDALEFLVGLLHNKPELIPEDFPWSWWITHTDANTTSTAHAPSSAGGCNTACNGDSAASCIQQQNDPVTHTKVSSSGSNSNAQQAQQEACHAQQAEQPHQQHDQPSLPGQEDKQEVQQRKWRAAPYLGPDIEEAHAAATEAGQTTYVDPATGYKVLLLFVTAFGDKPKPCHVIMAGSVLSYHAAAHFCRAALRVADVQHYLASIGIVLPSPPLSPIGVQTPMTSKGLHCIYGCLNVQGSQAAPTAPLLPLSRDCCSRHVAVLLSN